MLARPSSKSTLAGAVLGVSVGLASVLFPVLSATPAEAAAKTNTNCSPNPVNTSIPTPAAATNVSARKYGVEKGKAKVSWSVTSALKPSGYQLYLAILTSGGRCTKGMPNTPGRFCVKVGYSCILKRLPSGNTEFQVALWYQSKSGSTGPVVYSTWSDTVDVK